MRRKPSRILDNDAVPHQGGDQGYDGWPDDASLASGGDDKGKENAEA